jgi:hypothetical protein
MRTWLRIGCALVAVLSAGSTAAQETRGTISETVRDKDAFCLAWTSQGPPEGGHDV